MNNFKKLFAIILSAAMIVSLSACVNKKPKIDVENTTYSDGEYDESDEENQDDYGTESDETTKESSDDSDEDKDTSDKDSVDTNSADKGVVSDTKVSKQKIYDTYADKIKETGENGYYLYDMDGNGVPELFVDEGRIFSVYSYRSSLQKIGEVESYRSVLYVSESGNGLTLNRSKEDSTNLYHLTLNKGQIKQEIFLDASSSEGTMDEDKEQKIKDNCKLPLRNGSSSASGADSDLTMLKEVVMNSSKTANIGS